nr:hypothetical protein [Tanacetum cinerariifolium]
MRKKGCATWDGGKSTWGGRARGFGTVSVCMRVQESENGGGVFLAGRVVKGTVGRRQTDKGIQYMLGRRALNRTMGAQNNAKVEHMRNALQCVATCWEDNILKNCKTEPNSSVNHSNHGVKIRVSYRLQPLSTIREAMVRHRLLLRNRDRRRETEEGKQDMLGGRVICVGDLC